jgi:AraC family transcriptional regulator
MAAGRLGAGQYYGVLLHKQEVAGFTLTESTYVPGLRIPRHSHERAYFGLLLRGGYTETYDGSRRECGPASLVFHPGHETHAEQFCGAGGRLFRVEVGPGRLEQIRTHSRVLEGPAHFRGGCLSVLAGRLYREFGVADELSPLAIEGLVLELLAGASRDLWSPGPGEVPRWLGQARDLLHARFAERLDVEGVARTVGVHPVHLARVFRRHYRRTPGDYVRRLRVEHACRLLSGSDAPLAEVALAAGFADQSHLTRTFRRLTGTTPAAFRAVRRAR